MSHNMELNTFIRSRGGGMLMQKLRSPPVDATILEVGQNIALHALLTAFPVLSTSLPQMLLTHAVMRGMSTIFCFVFVNSDFNVNFTF